MISMQAVYRAIAARFGCSKQYVFMVDKGLVTRTDLCRNVKKALDTAHKDAAAFERKISGKPIHSN